MDKEYLMELIRNGECEWVEFKENWFNAKELGCYISAMSNAATKHGVDNAYFIWGVNNETYKIVGTNFKYDIDYNNEPLKHYLARLLKPSIAFYFETFIIENKKVVWLTIPAATRIFTEFDQNRYIRIGSSKELLNRYPEREIDLAVILRNGLPSIVNTSSNIQELNFEQLKTYYSVKGVKINSLSFQENLELYVPGTKKYNILAYILSDNNNIGCRVSIFNGKSKADSQYSLNDFGRKCMLYTIDQIINHLESLNITFLDERNRVVERKDISLFDSDCLREALLNAFIHNDWLDLDAPMISVFKDRIEILSYGSLPNNQTKVGFLEGKSKPRCRELAEIFLQLKISERSERGVLTIINKYGENVIRIEEDFVKVTIPFFQEREFSSNIIVQKNSKKNKDKIKTLITLEMSKNSNITTEQLIQIIGLQKTAIQKYIRELTEEGYIKHVGSKRSGNWQVLKYFIK